ncbi:T9SS type A sorting domain-containing protein [Polaribacter sp. Hel1_33_78]|uniref:T9SS type A sorting domain-containing protein n=1 Tax=Polaribacter sp. Hel1_33_78 TaxID=1336804 RepID=UPI000B8964DE
MQLSLELLSYLLIYTSQEFTRICSQLFQLKNTTDSYRENILLYPNPSSGILNIQTNHTFTPSIKIYNLIGELVFSEDNLSPNSQISLNQPPGIYMIVVKTNRSTSASKLILK